MYEFSYPVTPGAAEINLKTAGEFNYTVERTFEDALWYPQKSVVSYNESYSYSLDSGSVSTDNTMLTLNMGAYDVWY